MKSPGKIVVGLFSNPFHQLVQTMRKKSSDQLLPPKTFGDPRNGSHEKTNISENSRPSSFSLVVLKIKLFKPSFIKSKKHRK